MTRTAFINAILLTPDKQLKDEALILDGTRIIGLGSIPEAECGVVDLRGHYIVPGFVDIHTHGAAGRSFNEGSREAIEQITRCNAENGVTTLLPTLATAPIPDLVTSLHTLREWMSDPPSGGSQVLGVHLEGPYLSPAQAGAQDIAAMRRADDGSAESLLAYADILKIMTLAPEIPGALDLIERLVSLGIVAAAGHSAAIDADLDRAVAHGLSHCIHLWSSQSTTIRVGPWRKPGLLEASLASDRLTGEIIADNKHLPPTLMKLAYKCLGADRLCAVSDATPGAGLQDGSRFQMGNVIYTVFDHVGMTLDGQSFAGSATLLGDMLRILVSQAGIPLDNAVRMLTSTPARIANLNKGILAPGADADLVVLDGDLQICQTMIAGEFIRANSIQ